MPNGKNAAAYPPPAFHFRVVFAGFPNQDTSFQEVSGIKSEIEFEEVVEGGENRHVHRLPKGVKNSVLSLKRGLADQSSPLVKWCKSVMEGDFSKPIKPMEIKIYLLNEEHNPVRGWSFSNAYPVKWEIDGFNATKNEVAIESIELCYQKLERIK
jgi:phage tail-like protein